MKTVALCAFLACGLALSVAPVTPALAQAARGEPSSAGGSQEEAMRRFQRAVALYDEGDYAASLIEFNKAYELAPSYKLLYKIGQVSYKLKDYAGALRAFERYLKEGADKIAPERRAEVLEEINVLRSQTGQIDVVTNVFGATVAIDDVVVGTTPLEEPVLVSVGKRKISVTAPGRMPVTRVVDVGGQESKKVAIDLPALVGETRTVVADRPSKMTTWSWVGLGASGVLGIGAAVTGVMANKAADDLTAMTYVGSTPDAAIKDQQSRVKSRALATDILAGAAMVTLTTTLVWTFARPDPVAEADKSSSRMSLRPAVGFNSVGLAGEF